MTHPGPLTDAQRRLLRLFTHGHGPAEVAAMVKTTEAAVKAELQRLCALNRERAAELLRRDEASPVDTLLAAAAAHPAQRIRSLAIRATSAVNTLREAMADYDRTKAARERVARLEAELAEARKAAGITARPRKQDGPAQVIRAWAKRNGVDCPPKGRVPQRVIDAYERRHTGA